MGKADLAGPRDAPTSHQARIAYRVVGGTKRAPAHERLPFLKDPRHRMDPCCLQCLLEGKRREYPWESTCQHGFSSTGRAEQENVVTACRHNLQRSLRMPLAPDFAQVPDLTLTSPIQSGWTVSGGWDRLLTQQMEHHVFEGFGS